MSELKRNRVLVWCGLIGTLGTFIAIGSLILSAGELNKTITSVEKSQESIGARLTSIEVNQVKTSVVDSVFRADTKKEFDSLHKDNKNLQTRMTRLEWQHQLRPIEPSNLRMQSLNGVSQTSIQ